MAEERQSSFTYDKRNVAQASMAKNFVVRYEVVPADVQNASLALHMTVQSFPIALHEGPSIVGKASAPSHGLYVMQHNASG